MIQPPSSKGIKCNNNKFEILMFHTLWISVIDNITHISESFDKTIRIKASRGF